MWLISREYWEMCPHPNYGADTGPPIFMGGLFLVAMLIMAAATQESFMVKLGILLFLFFAGFDYLLFRYEKREKAKQK